MKLQIYHDQPSESAIEENRPGEANRRRRRLCAPLYRRLLERMFREVPLTEAQAGTIRLAVYRFEGMGLAEFDAANLEEYGRSRREAGKCPSTVNAEIARLKVFAGWLRERGTAAAPPTEELPPAAGAKGGEA